jgi:hypothetical protein
VATVVTTTAALGLTGVQADIFATSVVVCSTGTLKSSGVPAAIQSPGHVVQINQPRVLLLPRQVSLPGAQIVFTPIAWSPQDGAVGVPPSQLVRLNFAIANSNEFEKVWEGSSDFDAGTYDNTVMTPGGTLGLAVNTSDQDFDDLALDAFPSGWTNMWGGPFRVKLIGDEICMGLVNTTRSWIRWHEGLSESDLEITGDMMVPGTGAVYIGLRMVGSGADNRGYLIGISWMATNRTIDIRKITGSGNWFGAGGSPLYVLPTVPQSGDWWSFRVHMIGTVMRAKFWKRGDAEPSSWMHATSDSSYAGPGNIGMGSNSIIGYLDNLKAWRLPAIHKPSGTWISERVALDDVGRFSAAFIEWAETLPTGTTAAVYVRRGAGGAWLAATIGEALPGFALDDGLANDYLQTKVELTTSDTTETPEVDDLAITFDPMDYNQLELTVGGVPATMANGKLETWGKERVVGSGLQFAYDDLWCEASVYWLEWYGGPVLAQLRYVGEVVAEITFNAEQLIAYQSGDLGNLGYFNFRPFIIEANPNTIEWVVWNMWSAMGKDYAWVMADRSQGIHADARYWVAHLQIDDQPGSAVVAALNLSDHVGSAVYKGYVRDDQPGSALIQGDRLDDQPGSALVSEMFIYDQPGSAVVAALVLSDHVGSAVVYQVNRDGHLEYDVITDDTWAQMGADGFTMS